MTAQILKLPESKWASIYNRACIKTLGVRLSVQGFCDLKKSDPEAAKRLQDEVDLIMRDINR